MELIIIIVAVMFVTSLVMKLGTRFVFGGSKKAKVYEEESDRQIGPYVRRRDREYYTRIAGVQHNNSKEDIGGFLGYVSSDSGNAYDRNAIAIYRNDGKLVGFIPREEADKFREWSSEEGLHCIGFVSKGKEEHLYGKVKVFDADPDEELLIEAKFVRWMIMNLGMRYIPKGFKLDTLEPLRTKQDWLDELDDYIEDAEEQYSS